MGKLKASLLCLSLFTLFSTGASASSVSDDEFQYNLTPCLNAAKAKGIAKIEYKGAEPTSLSFSAGYAGIEGGFGISVPAGGLDKRADPGNGICCLYNEKDGKMILKDVVGVNRGNDECGVLVRRGNYGLGGLWWCVGKAGNCGMDWWRIEP